MKEELFDAEKSMLLNIIIQEKLIHEEQTGSLLEPRVKCPKEV